jgi:cytochrome c6
MKKVAISAVVIAALAFALSASAQSAADNYKSKCQMCHGADGKADTPMGKKLNAHDFHADAVQKKSDGELFTIIHEGVSTGGKVTMPGYKGKLTDDQIHDLVKYARELGKK